MLNNVVGTPRKISTFVEVAGLNDDAYFTIVQGNPKQNFIISKDNLMKIILGDLTEYQSLVDKYTCYFGYYSGETITSVNQLNELGYKGSKIITNVNFTNVTATNDNYVYFAFNYPSYLAYIAQNGSDIITGDFIEQETIVNGFIIYRSKNVNMFTNDQLEFQIVENTYDEGFILSEDGGLIPLEE